MRRAAATRIIREANLRVFAMSLSLMGLFAVACAPTYGEAEPTPGPSSSADTYKEKLPTDPKAKPATNTAGGSINTNSDAGSSPPKTPGGGGQSDAAIPLDGGACAKAPSPTGYVVHDATPQSIGACSTSDIGYYEGLLAVKDQTFGGIQKALQERNELCANCVFSKYEDDTWTPVVMLSADAGFYNWGSCYANSPGGSRKCAEQVQQWFSCLDDACGDCVSDAEYDACIDKASVDLAQCGALEFDKCGKNLDQLNDACDSIAKAIAVSCGP